MIQTNNLTKQFGAQTAVQDLTLHIQEGEIYGFLGPNGAGKTTTIRMLLGLTIPDSGEIFMKGSRVSHRDSSYRSSIGVVPEKHPIGMWSWMTASEYLQLFCDLYRVPNSGSAIKQALDRLQLSEHSLKPMAKFSRGMMQKLSFARAMIHNPDVLLLDEPISGLDPFGIRQIRDIILEEHRKGKTILLSSHLLTEIEKFCTRIGILYDGSLISEDATDRIISSLVPDRIYRIELESIPDSLEDELAALPFVKESSAEGTALTVRVDKAEDYRKALSQFFFSQGCPPLLLQEQMRSLEDAFLSITSLKRRLKGGDRS